MEGERVGGGKAVGVVGGAVHQGRDERRRRGMECIFGGVSLPNWFYLLHRALILSSSGHHALSLV